MIPLILAIAQAAAPIVSPPREVAPGVTLLMGGFEPGRGPDGNTVIFDAPDGLVVVDTGRHAWHSDAILAFAEARERPIAAIINTHWHLDHSSGNGRLKARYPNATVFTTSAVSRVLAPGGFLTRNLEDARPMLESSDISDVQREEVRIFIDTMEHSSMLQPDVSMQRSGRYNFARRRLDVHITDGAVTDADIWLYDRRTRVAVIGDLVTVPAPFFETACPDRWRSALDDVWATPFRTVIPGHGEPMNRDQFGLWRAAYGAFIDCVDSTAEASRCAGAWSTSVAQLLTDDRSRRNAAPMAEYYVGFLRENGGKAPDCLSN